MLPMLLVLLAACEPDGVTLDSDDKEPAAPIIEVSDPGAFDPILGGPVTVTATSDGGTPTIEILAADGSVVASGDGSVTWDGRLDGTWAAPGAYGVEVNVTDKGTGLSSSATAQLGLVRVGIASVFADGDDGVTAERVPLYWYKSRQLQDAADPVTTIAALDDGAALLSFPAVGTDLGSADEALAQPVAFPYDSRPILTLLPGTSVAMPASGLDEVEVDVAIDGWEVISGNPMADGVPVVLQKVDALATTPGVVEGELVVRFEAGGKTFGSQAVPYRAYALFAAPTWDASGPEYTAWVAAVDPALRGIQGVEPTSSAVIDALVEWIYFESGLSYDTVAGASAYTTYTNGWLDAEFSFTAFLERRRGTIVNCTDCASILLTYANMVGARLDYTIILENFQLNQIKAIGGDEFSNCPFGSWGCGFSYHAVTTNDAGGTIWDATLALDGDEDPGSLPSEELLVQTIDGEEYLDRLVMSGRAKYQDQDQGSIK